MGLAEQDAAHVPLHAQLLASVIEPAAEPEVAVFGVDEDVQTVECIAIGIIVDDPVLADQIIVAMRVGEPVVVHPDGQGAGHHPAIVLDRELALGEVVDQLVDGRLRPGATDVIVDTIHQLPHHRVVATLQRSQFQVVLFGRG